MTMAPHSQVKRCYRLFRQACFLIAYALILSSLVGIASAEKRKSPIVLEKSGGFAIGGKVIVNPLNSNQTLSCDHGYMEYFQPWRARKTSIVMWHSASTQAFQNRWDGGEGFKDMFLRRNYPVFLWDGPRVGRANWACESYTYKPDYRDHANFVAWNFGPTFQNWWPNSKFPTKDANAWQQATMNRYVEFDTFKNVDLETDAAAIAADSGKLGQSIVYMTNSAAGLRALMTASKSNTTNIKAIIAYETAGVIYPDNANISAVDGPFGPFLVTVENFKKLARIPKIQFVWGDHRGDLFSLYANQSRVLAQLINQYGGNAELLMLADVGLNGSTHSPFADMDNHKIAALADKVLEENCLDEYALANDLFGEGWFEDPNCVGSFVAAMGGEDQPKLSSWENSATKSSVGYVPRSIPEPVYVQNGYYDPYYDGGAVAYVLDTSARGGVNIKQNTYGVDTTPQGVEGGAWINSDDYLAAHMLYVIHKGERLQAF